MSSFTAVDLGASSGRVMLAEVTSRAIDLHEVHRFVNRPVRLERTLHWDVLALWASVLDGLRIAARSTAKLDGIAIDSWAIDYGLLNEDGHLIGNPVHYRDKRTEGVATQIATRFGPGELYEITGLQTLPFNTVYQIVAARDEAAMRQANRALLIPDLFGYWLTGECATDLTNASTTGLLDVRDRAWSNDIADRVGAPRELFPTIVEPGSVRGRVLTDVATDAGIDTVPVYTVASHDTASAVAGVPAQQSDFAYISCGTWSLVGVELDAPVTTKAAEAANFSNELGVDGTVRFLRNIMGLWLLQECVRTWERTSGSIHLPALLAEAATLPRRSTVDPNRPQFLPPGDMPDRIRAECRHTDQPEPRTPAEITRCILDSLADAYRQTVAAAAALSGRSVAVVHLVGGGARNSLLCQLTADACGVPVVAGPVEAAAYGNVLVQARAAGAINGDIAALRQYIPRDACRYYQPRERRT